MNAVYSFQIFHFKTDKTAGGSHFIISDFAFHTNVNKPAVSGFSHFIHFIKGHYYPAAGGHRSKVQAVVALHIS